MASEFLEFQSSNQDGREKSEGQRKDYSRRTPADRGRSAGRSQHKSVGGISRRRRKSYGL